MGSLAASLVNDSGVVSNVAPGAGAGVSTAPEGATTAPFAATTAPGAPSDAGA